MSLQHEILIPAAEIEVQAGKLSDRDRPKSCMPFNMYGEVINRAHAPTYQTIAYCGEMNKHEQTVEADVVGNQIMG